MTAHNAGVWHSLWDRKERRKDRSREEKMDGVREGKIE